MTLFLRASESTLFWLDMSLKLKMRVLNRLGTLVERAVIKQNKLGLWQFGLSQCNDSVCD